MTSTDNSVQTSTVDKAHGFLNMFKCVFTLDDGSLPTVSVNKSVSSPSNIYFSLQKVCAKLSKLKASFSSTPDEIPGFLLRNLCNTVCIPLFLLYQHFFWHNYLPPTWKTAHIVPIYKKGDLSKYDNYSYFNSLQSLGINISRTIISCIIVKMDSVNFMPLEHNY